jgi:hypothetical protein
LGRKRLKHLNNQSSRLGRKEVVFYWTVLTDRADNHTLQFTV